MLVPEYSITSRMLKNIASIEYARAIIEKTAILPSWENALKKEALVRACISNIGMYGQLPPEEEVKLYVDKLDPRANFNIQNFIKLNKYIEELELSRDFKEKDLLRFNSILNNSNQLRENDIPNHVKPDEILANINELFDWYQSLDSKETHPLIVSAIVKSYIELIAPFEKNNFIISNITACLINRINGYGINHYYTLDEFFMRTGTKYELILESLTDPQNEENDLTEWLEYYIEGALSEISNLREKIQLLEKETKVAKVAGRLELTDRQQAIIEYLNDYGIMRNSDFPRIFPHVSEDSVLRDLKRLISESVVVKKGHTKSSRYELK